MLITDKNKLKEYYSGNRIWQGIPSIEVTKKGRIFSTFYSGGTKEEIGNYAVVIMSDNGVDFGEPIAVAYLENHRCYDSCLWIDPLGRLWFTWAVAPGQMVYASVCDDPDSDNPVWSDVFKIGGEIMMNKPIVLTTGEWLFPTAVWKDTVHVLDKEYNSADDDRRAFAYKTVDNGENFEKLGGVDMPERCFDEHMLLELNDGTIAMYVRTFYGIGVSYSHDRGRTWTEGVNSGIKGPCSRFFIRRLKSGRILLVNHLGFEGRNNLAAMLSEDEGKTWKYSLMLDERKDVSYPDGKEADDGYIYITYDRERGAFLGSLEEAGKCAREILMAKITEEDIIAGKLVNKDSKLKCIISKLREYTGNNKNPFMELDKFDDEHLAEYLLDKNPGEIMRILFEHYGINCINMHKVDCEKLDTIADLIKENKHTKNDIKDMIALIRSASGNNKETHPLVERIKKLSENDELSVSEIAEEIGVSKYYMTHLFKKTTGITITDYRNENKISRAKKLLINSNMKITDIAHECGFGNASYFSEVFTSSEKVSPSRYRQLLKNSRENDKNAILSSMLPCIELLSNPDIEFSGHDYNTYPVEMPDDEFGFLHEAAIIEYHDKLFAAWYNNQAIELQGRTPIRFSISDDEGKTWSQPEIVADDKSGEILFCPPVFCVDDDTLYMFMNRMVAPDHIHSLDLYKYNEKENRFDMLWSRPVPFKLNTNTYTLNNGKLMIVGRIAELDKFPNTPAVLISDNGKADTEWRLVKIQENGDLPDGSKFIHPEGSAIIDGDRVYVFERNDEREVPIMYISEDNGETWSRPYTHDIPFTSSKIYSGTLSNGVNYLTGNVQGTREKLAIYFSEPGSMKFNKAVMLQDSYSEKLGFGHLWHYPVAHEYNGKLFIIYTVNTGKDYFLKRGAVVTVIDR